MKKFNRPIMVGGETRIVGASKTSITALEYDTSGLIVKAKGKTVPTDADAGYAVGCIFVDTDSGAGTTFYVNEGSATSCDFNIAAGEGGSSTHAMLSSTHTDSTTGTVTRGDIITAQGTTPKWTRLAKGTEAQMLIMGANEPAWASLTGDVTIGSTGTTAIGAGVIVDADVNAAANIAVSKLALTTGSIILGADGKGGTLDIKGNGKIIVGGGTTASSVSVTGDVTLANDGATTVTGLTIANQAKGDILYRDTSAWVRLAAGDSGKFLKTQGSGSAPIWDTPTVGLADKLHSTFSLEGGTHDPVTTVTAQSTGAAALTIPDLNNVAQQWVFTKHAQTLEGKTLTAPKIATTDGIADAAGAFYLKFASSTTPVNYVDVTSADAGKAPTITAAGASDNIDLHLHGKATGDVVLSDGTDNTKQVKFELHGATTATATTLAISQTDARTITFPDATTNLVGHDTADALSNKTLTTPKIVTTGSIVNANGNAYLSFVEGSAEDVVNRLEITSANTGNAPKLAAAGTNDNIALLLTGKGTGDVTVADAVTPTKKLAFSLVGATEHATTLTVAHTGARAVTLPDATCTLVGKDTTDILTNKTFDAVGTGNVLSNINGAHLAHVAGTHGTYGVPIILVGVLAGAGSVSIFNANAPFKFRVLDAWAVNNKADNSGNWKLTDGTGDITTVVTLGSVDNAMTRATSIDDARHEIAANGTLSIVASEGTDTARVYVKVMRITA